MWTCLCLDQWKIFSGNYQAIRVWLWLVYKFTKNNCRLRLFFKFIQTQKKVSYIPWQNKYLNLKNTCHIEPKIFLWTKLLKNLLLAKYLISVAATLKQFIRLTANICQYKADHIILPNCTFCTYRTHCKKIWLHCCLCWWFKTTIITDFKNLFYSLIN